MFSTSSHLLIFADINFRSNVNRAVNCEMKGCEDGNMRQRKSARGYF